jgi:hypothetical protein
VHSISALAGRKRIVNGTKSEPKRKRNENGTKRSQINRASSEPLIVIRAKLANEHMQSSIDALAAIDAIDAIDAADAHDACHDLCFCQAITPLRLSTWNTHNAPHSLHHAPRSPCSKRQWLARQTGSRKLSVRQAWTIRLTRNT